MKKYKLLVNALLSTIFCLSVNSLGFAQKTASLSLRVTEKSSLEEIFKWLDESSLPEARIGLEAIVSRPKPGDGLSAANRFYESAFFSKGFRFVKIDGCKVILRNNNVKLIAFQTDHFIPAEGSLTGFSKVQNKQSRFTGEISIPLQKLEAVGSPYRHAKKTKKTALFGTWRTEFKEKFEFSVSPDKKLDKLALENKIKVEIVGAELDKSNSSMDGNALTFTFDGKETSEDFYAAFSRAITLCKNK